MRAWVALGGGMGIRDVDVDAEEAFRMAAAAVVRSCGVVGREVWVHSTVHGSNG